MPNRFSSFLIKLYILLVKSEINDSVRMVVEKWHFRCYGHGLGAPKVQSFPEEKRWRCNILEQSKGTETTSELSCRGHPPDIDTPGRNRSRSDEMTVVGDWLQTRVTKSDTINGASGLESKKNLQYKVAVWKVKDEYSDSRQWSVRNLK